jgi:hypothetical protein
MYNQGFNNYGLKNRSGYQEMIATLLTLKNQPYLNPKPI